jgi:hypothetical protein
MKAKQTSAPQPDRSLLRHTVATLAYRGGKALRGAPEDFADFRVAETTRTPAQILAHISDLLDWALSLAKGKQSWRNSQPVSWKAGSKRFFVALKALDDYLASQKPLGCPAERLFQGPIADALTHVGQIAMLRRMAGAPVRAENYSVAKIAVGQISEKQPAPRFEFG